MTDIPALALLVAELAAAKENEAEAIQRRRNIEAAILAHPAVADRLPAEGTTRFDTLKIATGYTRRWDQAQLALLHDEIKDQFWPFRAEYREDLRASRVLAERFPALWAGIRAALTLTPRRPSITIEA